MYLPSKSQFPKIPRRRLTTIARFCRGGPAVCDALSIVDSKILAVANSDCRVHPWENWRFKSNGRSQKGKRNYVYQDNCGSPFWWNDYNKVKHRRAFIDDEGACYCEKANLRNLLNALGALYILESEYYAHIGGMQQLKSGVLFRRITLRLRNRWSDCGSLPICSFGQSDAKGESSEIVSNLSHTIKFKFLHLCFSGCMWPIEIFDCPPLLDSDGLYGKAAQGKMRYSLAKEKKR